MNIDDVITDHPKRIALYCSNFYSTLYQSNYSEESTLQFLDSLTETKTIDNDQSDFCDRPIKLGVVKLAIGHLKLNKSPGTDGIAVIISANKGADTRWSSNLITLIPKPRKDKLLIDNWRPICLLNNDYKVFAQIFAKRIKTVLDHIIDECQSGFMRHRHISNNVRLVLDLIEIQIYV